MACGAVGLLEGWAYPVYEGAWQLVAQVLEVCPAFRGLPVYQACPADEQWAAPVGPVFLERLVCPVGQAAWQLAVRVYLVAPVYWEVDLAYPALIPTTCELLLLPEPLRRYRPLSWPHLLAPVLVWLKACPGICLGRTCWALLVSDQRGVGLDVPCLAVWPQAFDWGEKPVEALWKVFAPGVSRSVAWLKAFAPDE